MKGIKSIEFVVLHITINRNDDLQIREKIHLSYRH